MNVSATAHRLSATGLRVTPAGRWTSVAGAAYVAAWLVGLVLAPSAPAADASAAEIHAYYAQSVPAILVQASLVHGVAGLALAVLALAIPSATGAAASARRLILASGLAGAVVSLAQWAFAVAATRDVGHTAAATSQTLFNAINVADTAKLVLLAVHRPRLAAAFVSVVTANAVLMALWAP